MIDFIRLCRSLGLRFVLKYKLGLAREGHDFYDCPCDYQYDV